MAKFICRKPVARLFSVCRHTGIQWLRREVRFSVGFTGNGWFLGLICCEKTERFLEAEFNNQQRPLVAEREEV